MARLLDYGEPQVLEIFKNTVPNRLYWVLFPIDNLCEAVETAKRFFDKGKDRETDDWTKFNSFYEAK